MKGDIKTLLTFLESIGKVTHKKNLSDEIEEEYSIELEPSHAEIYLQQLQQLAAATDTKIGIWFYSDDEEPSTNHCCIDLQVMRQK